MPVYEYKCKNCGEKFEAHRIVEDRGRGAKCPRCDSYETRRLFSLFSSGVSGCSAPPPSSGFKFG